MMEKQLSAAARKPHIAAIKIIAIILVAFNHTGDQGFLLFVRAQDSPLFSLYLFLSVFCKIAVPLFFMCSGALLLGKDEPFKRLFTHRILRYLIVLILFSAISYVVENRNDFSKMNASHFLTNVYGSQIIGSYWFLYAYLASLIMLPLIRKLARVLDNREVVYFIALKVVFSGMIPFLEYLVNKQVNRLNISLPLISDNIFYMVVGFWVENKLDIGRLKPWHLASWAAAGLLCILIPCAMTVYVGHVNGGFDLTTAQLFHSSLTAIPTIAAYVLIKRFYARAETNESFNRAILYLGGLTFGIYLVHMMFLSIFHPVFYTLFPLIRSLPSSFVWVMLTLIASGVVTAILKRIPYVAKLL